MLESLGQKVSVLQGGGMQESQAGLSLIELLLSLVLMAILAALAVPSFHHFTQQTRVRGAGSLVYGHLQQARSEALKRNLSITVCVSGSGTQNWYYQVLELSQASQCDSEVLAVIAQANSQQFSGVLLTIGYPNSYLIFKPRRNSLVSGNFTLSQGNHRLQVITWNNGIIRTCTDSQLPGVAPC